MKTVDPGSMLSLMVVTNCIWHMTYGQNLYISTMTGVTCGAGTAYPLRAPEFTPGFVCKLGNQWRQIKPTYFENCKKQHHHPNQQLEQWKQLIFDQRGGLIRAGLLYMTYDLWPKFVHQYNDWCHLWSRNCLPFENTWVYPWVLDMSYTVVPLL
jgi:hypothetical protein